MALAHLTRPSTQLVIRFGYDGSLFHGLQPQPGLRTAGGALVARMVDATGQIPRALSFAARTDAGVHAHANLATCRLATPINLPTVLRIFTAQRSDGLYAVAAGVLPRRVMARALAASKHYRYILEDGCPPHNGSGSGSDVWPITPRLDGQAMARAAAHLLGTHDFSALRDSQCSATDPVKTLTCLHVSDPIAAPGGRRRFVIDIEGDSFLRKMVRILVGTLAEVGCGLRSADSLPALLASGQRGQAGVTAPARGLTLVAVHCDPTVAVTVERALSSGQLQ